MDLEKQKSIALHAGADFLQLLRKLAGLAVLGLFGIYCAQHLHFTLPEPLAKLPWLTAGELGQTAPLLGAVIARWLLGRLRDLVEGLSVEARRKEESRTYDEPSDSRATERSTPVPTYEPTGEPPEEIEVDDEVYSRASAQPLPTPEALPEEIEALEMPAISETEERKVVVIQARSRELTDPTGIRATALAASSEKERQELLTRYREIEQALKAGKRQHCVFLSVDIAASTQMKVGEDETAIAASFQAYGLRLRGIFSQFGAWKQAWTPDGVMVCFMKRDPGVQAAKAVLSTMWDFNKFENRLSTPFRIRCGMNEGAVAIYQDSPLEAVSDQVIDVAGHMQKHARENTLWVSETLIRSLADKSGFRIAGKTVDGQPAYEWIAVPPKPGR